MSLDAEIYMVLIKAPRAVILFDAEWDVGPGKVILHSFEGARKRYSQRIEFGFIDVDKQQEIAKSVGLLQVPSVAYFLSGGLLKLVAGANQDVTNCIKEILW